MTTKAVAPTEPVIVPSATTTRVTAPLDADGYVDYLAALNQHRGQDISPEENAAIPLLEAIGFTDHGLADTNLIRIELGLPAWAPGMLNLVSIGEFVDEKTAGFKENGVVIDAEKFQAVSNRITQQIQSKPQPWKEAEFPDMAELLQRNTDSLKLVSEASLRPKYYRPMVRRDPHETLLGSPLPDVQAYRDLARQLSMRAMLHLGHDRVQEAQNDLLTLHRLASQISHGATIIESLVGNAIDERATAADAQWAAHPQTTRAQLAAYRQELTKLPPIGDFANQLNDTERFVSLDLMQAVARGRVKAEDFFPVVRPITAATSSEESHVELFPDWVLPEQVMHNVVGWSADWNVSLATINQLYDEIAEIVKDPNPRTRAAALAAFNTKLHEERLELQTYGAVVSYVLGSSQSRGEDTGKSFAAELLTGLQTYFETDNRVKMRRLTTIAGLAILEYRTVKGACPVSLKDLVPDYLSAVPEDINTGEPLKYVTEGLNFNVYSVGKNRENDGGRADTNNQKWDDVGFTMPPLP